MQPVKMYVEIGGELLLAVKKGESTEPTVSLLAGLSTQEIISELKSDELKKTFWINIYNAFFQILAAKENVKKPAIFRKKLITIGGIKFSLDDIEHGILRRYRHKFSLGYLPDPFVSAVIRKLAVSVIDYRIHFALNCGAASCPPIAFYRVEILNKQLDMAAVSFLTSETKVDEKAKVLTVTKLFQWFKGDFGGRPGILKVLSNHLKRDFTGYSLQYTTYDWTDKLTNFSE